LSKVTMDADANAKLGNAMMDVVRNFDCFLC